MLNYFDTKFKFKFKIKYKFNFKFKFKFALNLWPKLGFLYSEILQLQLRKTVK